MTVATSPAYELWDVETGNLIADYPDEDAALRAVREGVSDEGLAPWATVALARVEPGGERVPIVQGSALAARALAGPDGTIRVGGGIVDPSRVQEALTLLDTLASPAFHRAMGDLRAALTRSFSETTRDMDTVRAAVVNLSRLTGVPLRVDAEGAGLVLVTPNQALAGLLAVGVPNGPRPREVPIRAVPGGYAVDIAA